MGFFNDCFVHVTGFCGLLSRRLFLTVFKNGSIDNFVVSWYFRKFGHLFRVFHSFQIKVEKDLCRCEFTMVDITIIETKRIRFRMQIVILYNDCDDIIV